MKPVIRFENVSKRYNLHRDRPRTFRDVFVSRRVSAARRQANALWALRDVSFDIGPGETVALIGPNGAGKSTALKLISRVIFPNAGRIAVHGRVGALLELGTGFHPDLSGRDNAILAGALAGIGRPAMLRALPDIIEFSELQSFMDVPVKHYSSGMYARLAFSVSIHVQPEILLVDEVLAVGDQAFQQKCLDRLGTLKRAGVSLCFVSHSLETVRSICTRALWIDHGELKADGPATEVVQQYLEWVSGRLPAGAAAGLNTEAQSGNGKIKVIGVRFLDHQGAEQPVFRTGQPFSVAIEYQVRQPVREAVVGLGLHRVDGVHVTGPNTAATDLRLPADSGHGVVTYTTTALPLLDGHYQLSVAVHDRAEAEFYDYYDRAFGFRVYNEPGTFPERYGLMTLSGQWRHQSA